MVKKNKASNGKVLPKLFQRGRKGVYYFRMPLDGKDKWVSTGTAEPAQAKEAMVNILAGQTSVNAVSRIEKNAHELARVFVKSVTRKEMLLTPLATAYKKWSDRVPNYSDICHRMQCGYIAMFKRFNDWAENKSIKHVEDVANETALEYARNLWDSGISPKTYNEHLALLSRVFDALDAITPLPHRDPFDRRKIQRKRKNELNTASHEALEPQMLEKVIKESARHGKDLRDLFVIGSQTGMRLKDAVLLQWQSIANGFINVTPYKTLRTGNTARVPVTFALQQMLDERRTDPANQEYVLGNLARHYLENPDFVIKTTKRIFTDALGEDTVNKAPGKHRLRTASIYSFHSLRTTFMSLLAQRDVSPRDAMRMMGWESAEMIKVYERELEKARGDADTRTAKLLNSIDELKLPIPAATEPVKSKEPEPEVLRQLIATHSNIEIGKMYGVSEAAVRKWRKKL